MGWSQVAAVGLVFVGAKHPHPVQSSSDLGDLGAVRVLTLMTETEAQAGEAAWPRTPRPERGRSGLTQAASLPCEIRGEGRRQSVTSPGTPGELSAGGGRDVAVELSFLAAHLGPGTLWTSQEPLRAWSGLRAAQGLWPCSGTLPCSRPSLLGTPCPGPARLRLGCSITKWAQARPSGCSLRHVLAA